MALAQPRGVGSSARGVTPRNRGGGTSETAREFDRKMERAAATFRSPPAGVKLTAGEILAGQLTNAGYRAGIKTFAGRRWRGWTVRQRGAARSSDVIVRPYNVGATAIFNTGARQHGIAPVASGGTKKLRGEFPQRYARRLATRIHKRAPGRRASPQFLSNAPIAISYPGIPGGPPPRGGLPRSSRPRAYVIHPGVKGKFFVKPALANGLRVVNDSIGTLFMNELGRRAFTG